MTPILRLTLLLAALVMCASGVSAWDVVAGGIRYRGTGFDEVEVVADFDAGRNTYSGTIVIPESVHYNDATYRITAIADSAFYGSDITEIQIPNTVTRIGRYAMANAFDLRSVTLPMGLTEISEGVLAGTDIEAIAVPEGVTAIGEGAFEDCLSLRTVYLPYTLRYLDDYAFDGCVNLFEVYCAAEQPLLFGDDALPESSTPVDLVLADRRALNAWSTDPYFTDYNRFSLWINDDITCDVAPDVATGDHSAAVALGRRLAWRVYGPDGNAIAVTAAERYHVPLGQRTTTYVIAPTNLINEAEQAMVVDVVPPVPAAIEDIGSPKPTVVAIDGVIHVEGDNYGTWTRVYDVYGMLHYERPSVDGIIAGLQQGRVYIVVVGNHVTKLIL